MKKELNSSLIETDKSVTDAEYYHELYSVKHFRTMKKLFKQQLETNMAVTEQILSELKSKKYYSGKNIEIELFDILGRSALKGTLQHAGGLFQHAINISELNRGVYFLKISADAKSATVKVTLK